MERNYKNTDIGYELWDRGYSLTNYGMSGQKEAYDFYIGLYENGTVKSVDEFLAWMLKERPDMVYNQVEADMRYREENEPKIREYFAKHFEGKTWKEIDPERWDFYSDWHKDVFGYRPHAIVCGIYVNPHA